MRASRSRIAVVGLVCVLMLLTVGQLGQAATPNSGTIGPPPDASSVPWTGPGNTFVDPGPNPTDCQDEGGASRYDHFALTVDVTPDYWLTHAGGATVAISWGVPADDFDLYVCQNGTEVKHSANAATTKESVFIPSASGDYDVQVEYYQDITGEGYSGRATFETHEGSGSVVFDTTSVPAFAPATIVSAHFLGAEPQLSIEKPVPGTEPGAIDPKRAYIDWPLSSRTQTGQISRSLDGGDSFRLLLDLTCAERSRPNCMTSGGGDTEQEVNPFNGQLLFADQESLAQESLSSSADHGDTFPVTRQFAITDAAPVDRQWIGVIDPSLFSVAGEPIQGFLAYHQPGLDQLILGIGENGMPIPQAVPQVPLVGQSGQMRVDNTTGPGHGWIYQPFRAFINPDLSGGQYRVATAYGPDYQDPTAWHVTQITDASPLIFPWIALDNHGNAYAVWVAPAGTVAPIPYHVFLSVSPIDDRSNNPDLGGIPGSFWGPEIDITPPGVGSTVFPEVTAGSQGRIAVTFDGTPDFVGKSDNAPDTAAWNTYVEVLTNALGRSGPAVAHVGIANHRVIHTGSICTSGTTCTGDRSLLDMIDVNYDTSGRVGVVWTDNNSTFAQASPGDPTTSRSPFVHFAKEVSGPSLLSTKPVASVQPRIGHSDDVSGDATWPNVAGAANLPSLDTLQARLLVQNGNLVAQLKIADGTVAGMQRDLAAFNAVPSTAPPAQRLQYVVRFDTPDDIFFLSMEVLADGSVRFFGGKMDENDRILNPTSGATVGAAYNTDPGVIVTGKVNSVGRILMRTPLSSFGLTTGTPYYSATGFTMAGPEEQLQTLASINRTVDATPPFDGQL